MKTKFSNLKSQKGFTIIEIMIVLAIAALIMLVVFLAVPALQRSSHNTQRKSDVSHMAGLINEFESNNQGNAPTTIFISAGTSTTSALYTGSDAFALIKTYGVPANAVGTYASAPTMSLNNFYIYTGAICNGNAATTSGANSSSVVILYQTESSGGNQAQCTQI